MLMPQRRIVIVGGGIGGMALAAALTRRGESPLVLEQASSLGEVGSGLGVLPSAVHALRSLGVSEDLFANAAPLRRMCIGSHRGRDLSDMDLENVFERVGARGYVMRRTSLHQALVAMVDPSRVQTGARVSGLRRGPLGVEVILDAETRPIIADVVVGADGLRSLVRAHVAGDVAPRYAGETMFRGIADHELDPPDVAREVFGPGRRFGYYDLGAGQVYYWATSPEPQGTSVPPGERRTYLARCFRGWPFAVPALITSTPEDRILQNDIFDRPPLSRWHEGPIALLGDAAHPTTPNMGQGACMAIEDAVVMAHSLSKHRDLEDALRAYGAARSGRTATITRLSALWGTVGLWRTPAATWFRDAFYRTTPDALFMRILTNQYGYRAEVAD
jgi:2-polyprenyl-6-methoxyphenol hydroxylase-like FAD-dependent oxidoreductase